MHSVSITNTWTVCIHFSSTASVAKSLSRVENFLTICREHFNSTTKQRSGESTSSANKRLLSKKYNKHLLSSFQTTKSTQTKGSVFADRIEQVKKPNFELELLENVDCFLYGHGNYTSYLLSFQKKIFLN